MMKLLGLLGSSQTYTKSRSLFPHILERLKGKENETNSFGFVSLKNFSHFLLCLNKISTKVGVHFSSLSACYFLPWQLLTWKLL